MWRACVQCPAVISHRHRFWWGELLDWFNSSPILDDDIIFIIYCQLYYYTPVLYLVLCKTRCLLQYVFHCFRWLFASLAHSWRNGNMASWPVSLALSCSVCQMFSYSSASFRNSNTCNGINLFAALEAKVPELETQLASLKNLQLARPL